MSWIERMLEERLASAAASGELDAPHLAGKPLPDLDRPRPQGWWAEQFVRRERSHDRRQLAEAQLARARAGFWRASTLAELRRRVNDADIAIAAANVNLIESDRLALCDWAEIAEAWRAVHAR